MKTRHWIIFAIVLALAAAVERLILGASGHGTAWWGAVPGFFALCGFFGCLALAFLSKALGKYWLQRSERYYEGGSHRDD